MDADIDVSYRSLRRRLKRSGELLDVPAISLVDPAEIDELFVSTKRKGRERNRELRSRVLPKRERGTYERDESSVFTLVDCSGGRRYVVPAKSAGEATVQLLSVVVEKGF